MKILTKKDRTMYSPLESYKAGTPVRFESLFNPKHEPDDLFIVNAVCSSYRPENRQYEGKVCITNLRTGEIAYVIGDRRCTHVKVVVAPEEESC